MAIVDELVAILGYKIEGEAQAKKFEMTLNNIAKRADKVAKGLGRISGYAALATGAAFGLLGKSVVGTTAKFEQYLATLETIEKSSEKAKASLDFISDFAKSTPFEIDELTSSFVKLKAYGIDPVANDAFKILGDTASAMGKSLDQSVEAFADAATGEFERLKEFGLKAKTAGDQVTFAWSENGKEVTKTVKKNSDEIRAFLLDNFGSRFNGAMEKQSKTFNGMVSNLADTWTDFKRRIGEAGFFDDVKANLERLLSFLSRLDENGTLDRWAENLSDALSKLMYFFEIFVGRIATHVAFLNENWESLKGPLKIVGLLMGALAAYAFPVVTALALAALAVDDFLTYLQGGESVIGDFIEWFKNIGENVDAAGIGQFLGEALGKAFVGAFNLFMKIDWGAIFSWWLSAMEMQITVLANFFMTLGTILGNAIWSGLKSVGGAIKDWFASLIPEWAKKFVGGDSSSNPQSVREQANIDEENVMSQFVAAPRTDAQLRSQGSQTAAPSGEQLAKIEGMIENWNSNLAKMLPENTVDATLSDNRQDNRQFPMSTSVTVNQNVQQATDAPRAAAEATGQAAASAVNEQRTQVNSEPSF